MKLIKRIVSVWVSLVLVGSLLAPVLVVVYGRGFDGAGGWRYFRWDWLIVTGRRAGRVVTAEADRAEVSPRGRGGAAAPAGRDADEGKAVQAVKASRAVPGGVWRVRRGGGTTGVRAASRSGGSAAAAAVPVKNTAKSGTVRKASGDAGSDGTPVPETGRGAALAVGSGRTVSSGIVTVGGAYGAPRAWERTAAVPLPGGWSASGSDWNAAEGTAYRLPNSAADGGEPRRFYIRLRAVSPTGGGNAAALPEGAGSGYRALAAAVDGDGRCRVRGGWDVSGRWVEFDGSGARGLLGAREWRDRLSAAGKPSASLADAAATGDVPRGWGLLALLSRLSLACLKWKGKK